MCCIATPKAWHARWLQLKSGKHFPLEGLEGGGGTASDSYNGAYFNKSNKWLTQKKFIGRAKCPLWHETVKKFSTLPQTAKSHDARKNSS